MTLRTTISVASIVCAAALVAVVFAVIAGRLLREAWQRREARERVVLQPTVLGWMDTEPALVVLPADRRKRLSLVKIAGELAPKLRGADREAILSVLVHHGVAEVAQRDATSRRAVTRLRAAATLDVLARAESSQTLIAMLDDRDRQIRITAARALGRIGQAPAVSPLMDGLAMGRLPANTVSMAIVRIGPAAAPSLLNQLRSPNPHVRAVATQLLGNLEASDALFDLIDLLDDPNVQVAAAAAESLGRLRLSSAVEPLLTRLGTEYASGVPNIDFCIVAVHALGLIGSRRAIPILTDSLNRSHRLSTVAAAALESMGTRRSITSERARTEHTDRPLIDAHQ